MTRRTALKILDVIDRETQGKVAISMGYVGLAATNTATNNMLLFMRGPDDGELRVRLDEKSGVALADLRERLRKAVPEEIVPWLKETLERNGVEPEQAAGRAKQFLLGFEPGDIVSEVMSLGSPTPVEVTVAGPDREDVRAHALKVLAEMKKIPTLRDVQLYQQLDYPTVRVDINRQRGLKRRDGQGRDRRALGGHVLQPVRGQELLGRREKRSRLPGAGPGARRAGWTIRSRSRRCRWRKSARFQRHDPGRGEGPDRHRARRGGPRGDAAVSERHR